MWQQSMHDLLTLRPRPTAVIASDDSVAAVVMSTIQSVGFRIPEDIAVVGFDDQPFCILLNPSLTTIQLPIVEAGKRAAEMLLQRISGKRTEIEHLTLPCSLVPRNST
jgi:LacI family transcriptional regulator